MKVRTLIVLGVCCAALAALALWTVRRQPAGPAPEIGARLLRTEDINSITRVELFSGTQTVALARADDGWVVETRWNYPARFDQLVGLLRDLDSLRVAEIIRGGSEILADVGLTEDGEQKPVLIRLFAGGLEPADEIHLGKPRASAAMARGFQLPDSRYARRARGPVVLVEPFINDVSRRPSDWIRTAILDIRSAEIARMMAAPSNDAMYAVARAEDGGYWGQNMLHDQTINAPSADIWFRAFQGVVAQDVVDPAIPRGELGTEPAERAAAYLKNGLVVHVELGRAADDEGRRYAWFSFDYEGPEEGDERFGEDHAAAKAELERLNREVAPWTYVLGFSQANKFIFLRDQLVAAPAPSEP